MTVPWSASDPQVWWLNVRDKPALLHVVMNALAGGASISFEGDLTQCAALFGREGASVEESAVLKRNTIWPRQDFLILPLEHDTVAPILSRTPGNLFTDKILHVQIQKQGILAFGAYDNFDPQCVFLRGVSEASLGELQSKTILKSFEKAVTRDA